MVAVSLKKKAFENERQGKVADSYSNFFFQAEDGIRDSEVTGVQTCALPILINMIIRLIIFFSQQVQNYT